MPLYRFLRTLQRLCRAAFWLGLATVCIPLVFVIPRQGPWRAGFREAVLGFFCRRIYRVLNVHLEFSGQILSQGALLAPNHVSWLDVVILAGHHPLAFIAKADVQNWPLIGWLCQKANALFIRRDNKFHVYRESLPAAQQALAKGQSLVVFAEGTTANTAQIGPLYPMFFEAAVRQACPVQAIAIRYLNARGERSRAAAFIDDDGFVQSLIRIAASDITRAEIHFCPALQGHTHRKQLASHCQEQINSVLQTRGCPQNSFDHLSFAGQ